MGIITAPLRAVGQLFTPPQARTVQLPVSPAARAGETAELPPLADTVADPDALNQARERAAAASRRKTRSQLRIPLASTIASAGGGIQLP